MPAPPSRLALAAVRGLIDSIDDALLALLAARRTLVGLAAEAKASHGHGGRDLQREAQVYRRARRLGRYLGIPAASSDRLMGALIDDACAQQRLPGTPAARPDPGQGAVAADATIIQVSMRDSDPASPPTSLLRLLPPPARLAPLLRILPSGFQARLLEAVLHRVLAAPAASGALDALQSRRLGIEVSDLRLRWVLELRDGHVRVYAGDTTAEATVRGSATDLLLLASRREDADALFFQRRLDLTGDTELGLTARNLLDQLPWHAVPLGLRIVLHRFAGLAQAARVAYRDHAPPG